MRRDDKSLDHLRFEHIALPYCAKKGNCITQMAYAKAVIITPEMEYDTYPTFFQGEAQCVDALFRNGLEYLHLRKPEADACAYETFLKQVDPQYYPRIVLHDHFELAEQYGLKGVHLNQRNPYPPEKWEGHISRSCHSLEEVVAHKPQCDYLFLSPIFDSISKQGYGPSFSADMLRKAKEEGIIDDKVVALGGMSVERLPLVRSWGFGGVAFLGDVWNPFIEEGIAHGVEHFVSLESAVEND